MIHVRFHDHHDGGRGASMRPEVVSRYQMVTWFVSVIGTEESPLRKVSGHDYIGRQLPAQIE